MEQILNSGQETHLFFVFVLGGGVDGANGEGIIIHLDIHAQETALIILNPMENLEGSLSIYKYGDASRALEAMIEKNISTPFLLPERGGLRGTVRLLQ